MHYFIFPSWAQYRYTWDQLPKLFLEPKKYGLERKGGNVPDLVSLGYTVEKSDHEFFTGPEGGGIIAVKRPVERWFPGVLLRTDCSSRKPPGFARTVNCGIGVLIPKITAEHRLGMAQIPLAPSPFFSVERMEHNSTYCLIAFGFKSKSTESMPTLTTGFPELGIVVERSDHFSTLSGEAFAKISNDRLVYEWYRIDVTQDLEFSAKLSVFIYFGLNMAAKSSGCLVTAHIFSSSFIDGFDFPSATMWTKAPTRAKQTADEW